VKTIFLNEKCAFYWVIFFIKWTFFSTPLYAQMTQIHLTTRMRTLGYAGVGSVLIDESLSLNPASIAFFKLTTLNFSRFQQRQKVDQDSPSFSEATIEQRSLIANRQRDFLGSYTQNQISAAESHGDQGGSLGLLQWKSPKGHFQRVSANYGVRSLKSKTLGRQSAVGISLHYTRIPRNQSLNYILSQDSSIQNTSSGHRDFSDFQSKAQKKIHINMGVMHVYSKFLSLGFVWEDLLKTQKAWNRFIGGIQINPFETLSVMIDTLRYFSIQKHPKRQWGFRSGLQFRILDDFYLRSGYHQDLALLENGIGMGLAWVQPKLTLEMSWQKNYQHFKNPNWILKGQSIAWSLGFRL
jgi:hypothetical protein